MRKITTKSTLAALLISVSPIIISPNHPAFAAEESGLLQPLTVQDFLKLSDDMQGIYVGGLIEGMAFIQRNYSMPDYTLWV